MPDILNFARSLGFRDLPGEAVHHARRCLLDLLGVAAAGTATGLSSIIREHAVENFAAGPKRRAAFLFDGRSVSPVGAAMANAMTIDSVDAHDGYPECMGHVGVGILSAIMAMPDFRALSGQELLARIVVGYELGSRLGVAQHGTVPDYHTSGSWCALANAALAARALGLSHEQTRHAVGIAEYHGPRSQMMRVIDHPTMLKDGSGWGAMCGVSAALLAADGFTGAPALLIESDEAAPYWSSLGSEWRITTQYFKPDPVCRWAQPPVQAVRDLKEAHHLSSTDIDHIEVASFHEAVRLAARAPADTEQAQYSLPFPVAVAAVHGDIPPTAIQGAGLNDPEVLRLSQSMMLSERDTYNDLFPKERIADVAVCLKDGTVLRSGPTVARGSAENRLNDDEVLAKFMAYASSLCGEGRAGELRDLVWSIEGQTDLSAFAGLIFDPA